MSNETHQQQSAAVSTATDSSPAPWKAGDKVICTRSSQYGCKAGKEYVVQKVAMSEQSESGWWLWLDGLIGWADSIRFQKVRERQN